MTAAKHTPGPWSEHEVQRRIVADRSPGYRVTVAWMADACEDAIPHDVRDANARLIAAAPALLEALERAHALLDLERPQGARACIATHEPSEHYEDCSDCRFALVLDCAESAIAAARGES